MRSDVIGILDITCWLRLNTIKVCTIEFVYGLPSEDDTLTLFETLWVFGPK